ncbi:MAG: YraN family protein [Cellvibrionaceae bacterium]
MWTEKLKFTLQKNHEGTSSKETKKKKIGNWAEVATQKHLQEQGLKTQACNYNCPLGEIDLIMLDKDQLVFIEVRFRKNSAYGSAIESVAAHKQKKIIKAAQHYLQATKLTQKVSCRFDVVGVELNNNQPKFEWIKNAFY